MLKKPDGSCRGVGRHIIGERKRNQIVDHVGLELLINTEEPRRFLITMRKMSFSVVGDIMEREAARARRTT